MKTAKTTLFIGMLFVLIAAVFTGCPELVAETETETEVITINGSETFNSDVSYKVELGTISLQDYLTFQDWTNNEGVQYTFEKYKAERDVLYSQTIEGTYEDKGTLSATALKTFLMQNGQEEYETNGTLTTADEFGSDITKIFNKENGSIKNATWVYIEKVKAAN